MVILGISDGVDAAAAVVVDGTVVAAVEQERIDRVRHSAAFPSGAMDAALDIAGLRARDVDRIVVGGGARKGTPGPVAAALRRSGLHMVGYELVRRQIEPRLRAAGFAKATVEVVEQDRAQIGAAYRTQADDPVLLVLVDGGADGASVSVAVARNGQIEPQFLQSSLALVGRLPGIAGVRLGVPVAQVGVRGATGNAPRTLVEAFTARFGFDGTGFRSESPRRTAAGDAMLARYPADVVAAAAIEAVEESLAIFVAAWMQRTRVDRLVLAGTVFLDARLSGRIARIPGVHSIQVCPAPGGGAAALGAALGAAGPVARTLESLALGPRWTDDQAYRALSVADLPREKAEGRVEGMLAAGSIVARWAGPLPFGPRPLGARSALFRPDQAVRARAAFKRPAGVPVAMLIADASLVDAGPADLTRGLIAVRASDRLRAACPSLVHSDGTVLATLTREPALVALLTAVKGATGVAALGEISLNLANEPMACSPGDAIRAFRASGADALALGPYLVATSAGARQKDPKPTQSSPAR